MHCVGSLLFLRQAQGMKPDEQTVWHTLSIKDCLARLDCGAEGLDTDAVASRQQRYGRNRLPGVKPRGPLLRFLMQFHNVLLYIMLAASVVTALLGHWVDTGVI